VTSRPLWRTASDEEEKRPAVAELGPDRDRGQRADSVVGLQRAAAALRSREAREFRTERVELVVDAIDGSQRHLDRRTSNGQERSQIKAACGVKKLGSDLRLGVVVVPLR
jgi:hypothetical protein